LPQLHSCFKQGSDSTGTVQIVPLSDCFHWFRNVYSKMGLAILSLLVASELF